MTTINMHMKFEIEIPIKLDLHSVNHAAYRVQGKIKYGRQAAILKMT